MALRGGNALNRGSARSSAKFVKPKRTFKTMDLGPKSANVTVKKTAKPVTAMSRGAAKGRSKMMGGKGRYVGKR